MGWLGVRVVDEVSFMALVEGVHQVESATLTFHTDAGLVGVYERVKASLD